MLGIPAHPGAVGYALLLFGALLLGLAARMLRRRHDDPVKRVAAVTSAIVIALSPYLAWRVVQDLRVTTAMTAYERNVAGPVQAYLQPYLLDPVRGIVPPQATYATIVGPGVPYETARKAFPSLALETLFPRVSKPIGEAQWIVAWGIPRDSVSRLGSVIVARPASGAYPAVLVARLKR